MMQQQTLDDLTTEEFEKLLDNFIQRDDEEMPISTFFAALELIDREKRQQIIDVTGKLIEGKLFLSLPKEATTSIEVHNNEILIDENRKIIIHLNAS
ncbi:hypothetical protein H8E77_41985 [bacterium]|nr:hypothetical protein [bacterium]